MNENHLRQRIAILRILRDAGKPIGSTLISEEMKAYGYALSGRMIRLHLHEMELEGLVSPARRGRDGGRSITGKGLGEIRDALVKDRVGFMASKVDSLSYQITFDPETRTGSVLLNISLLDESHLSAAVREMIPVFKAGLGMGNMAALARGGERLGSFIIPPGKVGIGTVCSVTLNGVLLSARAPTVSRFGGVLEIQNGRPVRFTDVIYYGGTSLDPLEIFIKGGLTSVREAARSKNGRIGASFREAPNAALPEVEHVSRKLEEAGLGGVLILGAPSQSLLDFPVDEGRMGMIINGGLNPAAAIRESGIPVENHALSTLVDFNQLVHYKELPRLAARDDR